MTGELSLLAWCLFGIVFMWTPVHFWALALMIKEDYRNVGVPMAPIVIGDRATVMQMVMYAVLTVALTIIPFVMSEMSVLYVIAALLLNVVLALRLYRLYLVVAAGERSTARPHCRYLYSMSYLALIFLAMAVDRMIFF